MRNGLPYYEWLGIPKEEQPPNYYRLLGLRELEGSASVIDNAANRQMLLVKTFQNGPHSELSQQILNEISQARACLLNTESKAEYDAAIEITPVIVGQVSDDGLSHRAKTFEPKRVILFKVAIAVAVVFGCLSVALLFVIDEQSEIDDSKTLSGEVPVKKKPANQQKVQPSRVVTDDSQPPTSGTSAGDLRQFSHLNIKFRWCPAGSFKMGDPENGMSVSLSRGFWIGQTEVTQREWMAVVGTKPWTGKPDAKDGPNYPAAHLTWYAARDFCKRLTTMEATAGRMTDDWRFSIPTEAQWEYACRAGTESTYCFGNEVDELAEYAWFDVNADKAGQKYAHKVGLKRPNSWGLYDMHGNVYEWCQDSWNPKLKGGTDPYHEKANTHRVIRGGSWLYDAKHTTSAVRLSSTPGWTSTRLGFRLVLIRK